MNRAAALWSSVAPRRSANPAGALPAVACVDAVARLGPHARVALDAPERSWLERAAWYEHFERTVSDPRRRIRVVCVDDSRLVVPLALRRRVAGAWPITVAESLANYYSLLWEPAGAATASVADWRSAIRACRQLGAARLEWQPIAPERGWLRLLLQALEVEGWHARIDTAFGNWHANVAGRRFHDWFGQRPSALRHTWQRRRRRLESAHRLRVRIVRDASGDLERDIDAWQHVYARSWKVPEPHPGFVPGLIRRAAAQGVLRLGLLEADGQPVAAQLWLRDGPRAVIYKLAHDEAWRHCSPGLVLAVEMFREAIDVDRVDEIDFGSGDDAYKRDWMDARRPRVRVVAHPLSHPLGLAAAWRARRAPDPEIA